MAAIVPASLIPARCRIAPEMPTAMYNSCADDLADGEPDAAGVSGQRGIGRSGLHRNVATTALPFMGIAG